MVTVSRYRFLRDVGFQIEQNRPNLPYRVMKLNFKMRLHQSTNKGNVQKKGIRCFIAGPGNNRTTLHLDPFEIPGNTPRLAIDRSVR
jgi:hypothetical protein